MTGMMPVLDKPPKRRRRLWIVLGVIALLVLVRFTVLASRNQDIIVGRDTTWIDAPLSADGTVNYVAWLDRRCNRGVTAENNAAPLLIRAFGAEVLYESTRARIMKRLDMPPVAADAKFFVSFDHYVKSPATAEDRSPPGKPASGSASAPAADEIAWHERLDRALEKPWGAKDDPVIAAWLKSNDEPLELVIAASRKSRYYLPLVSTKDPPAMAYLLVPTIGPGPLQGAAMAMVTRSMLKLHANDVESAWADLLAAHRLARLLGQGPTLIDRLISMTVERVAYEGTFGMVRSGKLSAAQARRCLADLQAIKPMPDVVEAIDSRERLFMLDIVMLLKRESNVSNVLGLVTSSPLDWNEMLRAFNRWWDRAIELYRKPYVERENGLKQFERELADLKVPGFGVWGVVKVIWMRIGGAPYQRILTRIVSDGLLSVLMPGVGGAVTRQESAATYLDLAKLSLALAACKGDKGRFPVALDALKGRYVNEIPVDVFSGGPLIYKRTEKGYLLY
ncbi:MAG: hypothetical protein QF792_08210, partial [Phycisphaerae bacterium]|nr:hypothetical protein [Phycisphaerae bacterium]